jgi:hypothetical protein
MLRRVVWLKFTDVSEMFAQGDDGPEDGGSKRLWNVGNLSSDDTT